MPPKGKQKAGSSRLAVLPAVYPGKIGGKGLEAPQWGACKAMLEGVYIAKNGTRYIGDIFRELPDKEVFADYYQSIPEPESLDNIAAQLGKQAYPTPEAFYNQLQLVFLNAKHYNEEGSQIYTDAKQLESQIQHAWKTNHTTGVFSSKVKVEAPTKKPSPAPAPAPVPAPATAPVARGRGRPRKTEQVPSTTPRPATLPTSQHVTAQASQHRPTSITLNIRNTQPPAPKAPSPLAPSASPAARTSALPQIPSPVAAPFAPLPATPAPVARPMPTRVAEIGAPGISQYTTAAALVPPPSPNETEKAIRKAAAAADREFTTKFERGLPHWEGPEEVLRGEVHSGGIEGSGWFGEGPYDVERRHGGPSSYAGRIRGVLHAITEYRDPSGLRLSDALAQVPANLDYLFLQDYPLVSLDIVRQTQYQSLVKFDKDMSRVFERGRRFHPEGSPEYGHVIVLQRLYNALTAAYPMTLPPNGIPPPNPTKFASLPAGPGTARPLHEITQDLKAGVAENQVGFGITTFRVGTKDRTFTEEARHKGMAYKIGDYIHLINPDDASRPIVGQIFKTFVPTKGYRTHHVTVCWYYRPEQIVHRASRLFFEREIFKTSHFCDHPVEDIIERVGCQFYVKAIRGRPQRPEWYPGWPLYICHSRYNDRGWFTVRIKNWASCIPDELRQTGFMDVETWDRIVEPHMVKSPFLRGIQGPGFFAEPREGGEDEDEDEGPAKKRNAIEPNRRTHSMGAVPGPKPYTYTPSTLPNRYPAPVSASQGYPTPRSTYSPATYRQTPNQHAAPPRPAAAPAPSVPMSTNGRTIANLMGGPQVVDQLAVREYLPIEVARLFERDSRNQVLWFSGPPLVPGQVKVPTQPTHSLEYLEYLTKRKHGKEATGSEDGPRGKRYRTDREPATPVVSGDNVNGESEDSMWWAQGMSGDQIAAALLSVLNEA